MAFYKSFAVFSAFIMATATAFVVPHAGPPFALLNETGPHNAGKLPWHALSMRASNTTQATNTTTQTTDQPADYESHFCFDRWPTAERDVIDEGMQYLRGLGGNPRLGAGPGTCSRVSCSYNAAIYWCNDNTAEYTLDNFGRIADAAHFIAYNCEYDFNGKGRFYTSGQVFFKKHWNVYITGGERC
ncbi:hypothetical protein B0T25DRAFT_519759 [Lasiosphaeria hispida]|uniref:Uncharacterized protein n=1 Tax=Lasiosphaeria hispida TaxID=260671 RepID=A0AAJ0MCJ3_9PEZI|nr:hypothetical protein B0T25DRAFT_519759 [Lasiosphaeria hispida]